MAVRDVFKIGWKTFINPAGWLDYEGLKSQNGTLRSILGDIYAKPEAGRQETYAEACERLGMTDAEAQHLANQYVLYAYGFFLIGIVLFAYAFYLLFSNFVITGFLLGIAATAFCLAQAFRYHFWSYQIQQRRLGATFAEWKTSVLNDKRPSP